MIENPEDYTNFEADVWEITYSFVRNPDIERAVYAMTPSGKSFTIGNILKLALAWFDAIDNNIMIIGIKKVRDHSFSFFTVIEQ